MWVLCFVSLHVHGWLGTVLANILKLRVSFLLLGSAGAGAHA